ncbi:MAG: hypothetical protein A3G87_08555 [Omnitrophica bacterium RIFCSPLOWO2_12_FULL_50_11]|nr:MAG: hypothetical protein A3G87_08555 [Omnitrophica bacterium RIFCSPLOWO2_12_FULL_50_11]
MFWRILFDSIVRRKKRKGLAILAVWIGISLVVGLLMLSLDTGDKMNLELRSFGANIKVMPVSSSIPVTVGDYALTPSMDSSYLTGRGASPRPVILSEAKDLRSFGPLGLRMSRLHPKITPRRLSYLEESDFPKLKEIFWRNNIMGIVPRLWTEGEVNGSTVPILGLWLERRIPTETGEDFVTGATQLYKHWSIRGSWPSRGDERTCLMGVELARRFSVSLGDTLEVKGQRGSIRFQVSGIVSTGTQEDSSVITSLDTVQRLTGLEGKVSEADVSALTTPENKLAEKYRLSPQSLAPVEYERWSCTPYPENVASGIQDAIPNSAARVIRRVSETQGAVLTRIKGLVFFLAIVTLISCSLSIMGILASAVLERRPEVALLQAIGAERSHVLTFFLVEVALLGIVGGFLGGMTGSWIGQELVQAIFASKANDHLALVILSPFLGLGVASLGSLRPVLQALGEDTAQVLHGN